MYGCTCAWILIESAWSNLCHVKITFFILCSWPTFDCALLQFYYLEVLALHDVSSNASIHLWAQVLPHLSFSYLQLCYKFTSHNFLKLLYVTVMLQSSGNLYDFRWYSFEWVYQQVCAHHSRSREGKRSCYGRSCNASMNFIHVSSLHAKNFPEFGKNYNLIHHRWKFLLGPEECPAIFLLSRHLQPAEGYIWKIKISSYLKNPQK